MATDTYSELEAIRRPLQPGQMPAAGGLRTRVSTSSRVRRALPTGVMVKRAEARGLALWRRDPGERARARHALEAIVGGTERESELDALAPQHVIEAQVRETLFWQPWRAPALDGASARQLRQALDSGRGVLVSSCHSGPYLHGVSAVGALGRTTYSASAWTHHAPTPGYWGRRIVRRREEARRRNERLVRAAGSFALLQALLREREVVSVFFAMPGGRETKFLGKPVMLASGSARLAMSTDALVLPIRTRRAGPRVWVDVAPPLDPRELTELGELHETLAATHERWILELPASMEDPNREGAWEQSATAAGWLLPRPPAADAE